MRSLHAMGTPNVLGLCGFAHPEVLVKRNAVLAKEIIAARQQNAELKKEVAHQAPWRADL